MLTRRAVLGSAFALLVLIRKGFVQPETQYVYGPWRWETTQRFPQGCWMPPQGTVGTLDLRSIPQCGQRGGEPGMGVFATQQPLGSDYQVLHDVAAFCRDK